ncbi:MAG: histidine kinase dimerization/phospho-acceptor domain-containing protein, partial [Chloroflexota bacterium]
SDDGNGQYHKVVTKYLVKSLLKVPIKDKKQVLGVLSVDHAVQNNKMFSTQDLNLLTILAKYAAIAIDNAQRYERATQYAEKLDSVLKETDDQVPLHPPPTPTRESDREALQKFNEGLRSQQDVIAKAKADTHSLTQSLQQKVDAAQEIASQLATWETQVGALLPQLDWIAQTALRQRGTAPLNPDHVLNDQTILLDLLLSHLKDGVLFCNRNGDILNASHSAERILKVSKETLCQRQLQELFPDDAHWEHLVGSVRLGISLTDNTMPPPPTTSATFYQGDRVIQATLYSLNQGRTDQDTVIVALLQDLSVEAEGWRVRDEMVNELSEKLRTPLSTVHTYSDMLLNESVGLITTKQRRYLERIRQGVDQMEEQLKHSVSLLKDDLTRSETNEALLLAALKSALNAAREELTLAGVKLKVDINPPLPPIQVSLDFFTRIMTELLIKAGTHVPQGHEMHLSADLQQGETQPHYLVINIVSPNPRVQVKQAIKDDPDIQAMAKAAQYHGGRIWIDIDYQGQWTISFLLPTPE